ncbi:hypothetical protein ACVGOW_01375 [Pseudonocardia saturnea]
MLRGSSTTTLDAVTARSEDSRRSAGCHEPPGRVQLGRSFLGIEVKYHEDLSGKAAKDEHGRYAALADKHGIFREDLVPALQKPPLQQIWLDHLLALQLRSNPKTRVPQLMSVLDTESGG